MAGNIIAGQPRRGAEIDRLCREGAGKVLHALAHQIGAIAEDFASAGAKFRGSVDYTIYLNCRLSHPR